MAIELRFVDTGTSIEGDTTFLNARIEIVSDNEAESTRRGGSGADRAIAKLFRRVPGNTPSSPCPQCAPFIGVLHDRSGKDIPVPPLHLHCACKDVPESVSRLIDNSPEKRAAVAKRKFDWLKSIPKRRLQDIIGPVRMRLVADGKLKLSDLWNDDFEFVSLSSLGFDQHGNRVG